VVLPIAEWERLQERLEDRADIAAAAQILADPGEYRLPLEVVERIADGIHPVRALREWRGLSRAALAEAAGVAQPTVARIESTARGGSARTLSRLARALGVPVAALMD
jgi:DNA-binding XRE family transcriptional regulator